MPLNVYTPAVSFSLGSGDQAVAPPFMEGSFQGRSVPRT